MPVILQPAKQTVALDIERQLSGISKFIWFSAVGLLNVKEKVLHFLEFSMNPAFWGHAKEPSENEDHLINETSKCLQVLITLRSNRRKKTPSVY